jgi:hypothetical protein
MAALRADNDKTTTIKVHTSENVEKVLKLLRRAESLDQDYIDWIDALPASWSIKTVAWIDGEVPNLANSVIHPGRVDAYGELWMAYKYNIVRSCRLFIWTVILRCVAWLGDPRDYRLSPEYTTASRICQQLVEDIVSSVPYFFGWNRDKDSAMADNSNFACGADDPTAVRPLAGLFVMWPLFSAASSDFATPTQRIFLRGRLKFVAEMMGINQALILFQVSLVVVLNYRLLTNLGTTSSSFNLHRTGTLEFGTYNMSLVRYPSEDYLRPCICICHNSSATDTGLLRWRNMDSFSKNERAGMGPKVTYATTAILADFFCEYGTGVMEYHNTTPFTRPNVASDHTTTDPELAACNTTTRVSLECFDLQPFTRYVEDLITPTRAEESLVTEFRVV